MSERIVKYTLLAKPGIVLGNLISTAAGILLASKGLIDFHTLAGALIGVSLVVASGCVFNNIIDRNLDRKMIRTRDRALAKGLISIETALCYAAILGVMGLTLLLTATNTTAVVVTVTGFLIYVGVYSLYVKRHSIHGALIGSLAGAAPPVAGYCAVTGRFDMGAVILAAIFSLWQMPHCYAIAIVRYEDYAAAAIPILPIKNGTTAARRHMVGYILAFTAAVLALTVGGYAGYGVSAAIALMALFWLYLTWWGYDASNERLWAGRLYTYSILTVGVLCAMMAVDFTAPFLAEKFLGCVRW